MPGPVPHDCSVPFSRRRQLPQVRIQFLSRSSVLVGSSIAMERTFAYGIRILARPRRFAASSAEMRGGEIAFAAGVEQVLDAVEIEEEGIAAGPAANVMSPAVATLGCGPNEHLDIGEDLFASRLGRTGLFTAGYEHVDRLAGRPPGGERTRN